MIQAKEIDGELWIKASDHHQAKDEPVACKECHLKDTVYDLLGDLKVANLKLSVRSQRTWVGLTDEERYELLDKAYNPESYAVLVEAKLKEKNT